jgi:putative endonuclease
MYEHKSKLIKGFSQKYNLNKLVYYDFGNDINFAIEREKKIKAGSRKKKIELIISMNPEWNDLSNDLQ